MVKGRKAKQTKSRQEGTANTQTPSPIGVSPTFTPQGAPPAPQPPVPAPAISPELRDELTASMQQLLLKTHELSFEYSTLDCEEIRNCPLAQKARELFKVVKHLNELMKKMTPPERTSYVS